MKPFLMTDRTPILSISNLTKTYPKAFEPTLKGIDLSVQRGEIFGLLGPNGAGKTTLISILCGLARPTSGDIQLDGHLLPSGLQAVKPLIGVVPQDIALYPTLTARENLQFFGAMYGLQSNELNSKISDWLQKLGLSEAADRRLDTFSGGMKRRVNLIASILHRPKLLILDEPTVGVDVQSRNAIIDQLELLNKEGMTIIYTSHHLEEAQDFCTKVAIMDYGQIILTGKPDELISQTLNARNLEDVFLHLTKRKPRD
jgi:ABC-2 type transport system ATP-binding protein